MNEGADERSKEAAEVQGSPILTPTSLSTLLQKTRDFFHLRTANFNTGKKELKTQPRKVADALAQPEKGEAESIFHLQSGHSPLNEYLRRFNHHPTGRCDHCNIPEKVAHFLLNCSHFKVQRRKFRTTVRENKVKVNTYSLPSLLNTTQVYPMLTEFILDIG